MIETVSVAFAFVAGLVLPGYLLARLLRAGDPWVLAFPLSLVVLFHCTFFTGVLGLPVRFATVLVPLLAIDALLAVAVRRGGGKLSVPFDWRSVWSVGALPRVYVALALLMSALLLHQCLLTPLSGYDTYFRWDYLAERVLELRSFAFYPPRVPAHFRDYSFVDGFPPIVSFSYWWLYAAAGRRIPELTSIVLVAQYVTTLGLVARLAAYIAPAGRGVTTGATAAAIMATSSLYFRSQAIGQETGLTALSLVAMLYVIVCGDRSWRTAVLAALAGASGAMCREYGLAFVAFGSAVWLYRYRDVRNACVLGVVGLAAAAPWYVRNLVLTGNPFFSLRVLGLPVNEVFAGMMDSYKPHFGVRAWTPGRWWFLLKFMFTGSPLQLTLGVAGAIVLLRRHLELAAAALLVVVLWIWSTGYTNGGEVYSTRVLTPVWAILSVTAAVLVARWSGARATSTSTPSPGTPGEGRGEGSAQAPTVIPYAAPPRPSDRRFFVRPVTAAAILLAAAAATVSAWIFPFSFYNPPPSYLHVGLHAHPRYDPIQDIIPHVRQHVPKSCRILGDEVLGHRYLRELGYEMVVPWSPEVAFLFDPKVSAEEATRRLRQLGICAAILQPNAVNYAYFTDRSAFFRQHLGWKTLAITDEALLVRLPDPPP